VTGIVADIKKGWHRWLVRADSVALALMGVIGVVITVTAFAESYGNLYDYARLVGMAGWRARIAPLGVDLLILTGELLLFVAIARGWEARTLVYGWTLVAAGLGLSVAGNVGHVHQAGWQTRVTFALWPAVLTAGLAAGLMALKRVSETYRTPAARPVAAATPSRARVKTGPASAARTRQPGRPAAEVVLPAGAVEAARLAGITSRKLSPWLADTYHVDIPLSRWKAGQLLAASANGTHPEETS
jgi:Protein of unknown function (DUF2637)